ncbi:MAG TPA: LLM class flavin-dependent oxidoreductase [Acidimicrobiales bacterium]|nr:LLM class flavin-dependent oxidoreductase [Acidimicrobiales bacterium]
MKIGITLPQFSADPHAMIAAARRAEDAGIDGVFVYDHYPRPDRPEAQHGLTMLGALAVATERINVGLLVARVGVVPDRVLLSQIHTAARLAGPHRFIAGVGVGDRESDTEDVAIGITRPSLDERFARLEFVAATLHSEFGLEVWLAGKSARARHVATTLGVTRNLWDPSDELIKHAVAEGPVTWGATGDVEPDTLRRLADLGVGYAVVAPLKAGAPDAAERVMSAKDRAGLT